jgi:lambda repressor-like predicted transcriptional regulator
MQQNPFKDFTPEDLLAIVAKNGSIMAADRR